MRVEIPNQITVTIGGLISRGVKAVEVTDAGKLIFTLTDGSNLKLAGDFVTTADDTWSGCYDGTNWFESGRSVN